MVDRVVKLEGFKPRSYQLPIFDAIENKGYKRVLAILPRRAGKDVCGFNLMIRAALTIVGVYYYIFPTFAQAKRVIWDSLTNDGRRFLDYIPEELIEQVKKHATTPLQEILNIAEKKQRDEKFKEICKSVITAINPDPLNPKFEEALIKNSLKKNIKAAYPGVFIRTDDLYPKQKLKDVIRRYKDKRFIRFIDPETLPERPTYKERPNLSQATPQLNAPVQPLPDTGTPVVNPTQIAAGTTINNQTGLTDSESIYLSPTEQLYRRRERGTA